MTVLLYLFRKVAHRLFRDGAPVSLSKGMFCFINSGENLGPRALALLPKGECLLHRIFLAIEPSTCNRLANECFLVRCELYFYCLRVGTSSHLRKHIFLAV